MNVSREYSDRHIALEAHDAVVPAQVQAMRLQRIDGGLHRAVLPAQGDEFETALSCPIDGTDSNKRS